MKRSNRLVLLIGVLLAVVAFGAVIVLFNARPQTPVGEPAPLPTVYAKVNIPLGTAITADMVEARPLALAIRPTDAFGDVGLVIGKTVRTDVSAQALITPAMFASGAGGGQEVASLLDKGLRAMALQVDQTSGVGTLINVGDRVDLVVGFTGADKVPTVTIDTTTKSLTTVSGINPTTVKVLLQNMQVIGTIAPAAPTASGAPPAGENGTLLSGQLLVILAVTPQQAEVIKFSQMDGQITMVLRSPKDFRDASGAAVVPNADATSGIVLKTLIDNYGLLPPQVIKATGLPTTP